MDIKLAETPDYSEEVDKMVRRMRKIACVDDTMGPHDAELRIAFNASLGLMCHFAMQSDMGPMALMKIVGQYVASVINGTDAFHYSYDPSGK